MEHREFGASWKWDGTPRVRMFMLFGATREQCIDMEKRAQLRAELELLAASDKARAAATGS